jgi:RNA polymerase sigma factor (sigma-70 family)
MLSGQGGPVLGQMERLFAAGSVTGMNEGQLLDRFVSHRDEAAFAALVTRYGPMVLSVCRQMLRDPNDVEDAFQATFLVLVRKAGTLRNQALVGNWLYGVAFRTAQRARASAAKRHASLASGIEELAVDQEPAGDELRPLIHEELHRLPEKYRTPIVLCYLEGLTHEEAAERLAWPLGTVKGRLARARDQLRSRLARRGLVFSQGALALALPRDASSAVPSALFESTIRAAAAAAAGRPVAAGVISAQAAALSEGVIQAMFFSKLKLVGISLAIALATASAGVVSLQIPRDGRAAESDPQNRSAPVTPARAPDFAKKAAVATRPMTGADVKNGQRPTTDFAAKSHSLAQQIFNALIEQQRAGEVNDLEDLYQWSLRIADAESSGPGADGRKAAEGHLKRMQEVEKVTRFRVQGNSAPTAQANIAAYFVSNAEAWLARTEPLQDATPQPTAKTGPLPFDGQGTNVPPVLPRSAAGFGAPGMGARPTPGGVGGAIGDGPAPGRPSKARLEQERRIDIARMAESLSSEEQSAADKAVLKKLDEPIGLRFAEPTPLEDLLKFIKSASQGPTDSGIPIYVDPQGLNEANATLTSTVTIDLEGVPLKATLRLALKQLGLAYCVKDGVLMISSINGIYEELEEATGGP